MKSRITRDADFNKTQLMLRDPWFQEELSWLKKRFKEVGCPVPEGGFAKAKEYFDWYKRYWARYSEMKKSDEYKKTVEEITEGKDRISLEELNKIDEFEFNFLPPLYGQCFDQILKYFNVEKKDRKYFKSFIKHYLFLGIKEFPKSNLSVRWIDNKDGGRDLVIQIFGRTKKEDLDRHWDWISQFQKHLPDYIGKNKTWEAMDRDLEIFHLYKELRDSSPAKRHGVNKGTDTTIYIKLHRKYPELTITSIRTIIAKTKKRLGEV